MIVRTGVPTRPEAPRTAKGDNRWLLTVTLDAKGLHNISLVLTVSTDWLGVPTRPEAPQGLKGTTVTPRTPVFFPTDV